MGPWTHGGKTMELSYAGDVEFGPDAALASFNELHLRWYDRWLLGVDNGLDGEVPLRLFVMGGGSGRRSGAGRLGHGGRWRDEHEWPLARTRFTDFYLHGDGSLTTDPPREAGSATTYRFDPARPVPSIGGNVSSLRDVLPLPPASRTRATPAAASAPPTSCARAASTSARPPASTNFPRFDVNPNTGEAIGRERRRVVADKTVFHERGRESRVVVPIVSIGSGPASSSFP